MNYVLNEEEFARLIDRKKVQEAMAEFRLALKSQMALNHEEGSLGRDHVLVSFRLKPFQEALDRLEKNIC